MAPILHFRFVAPGSSAPATLPADCLWIDVGNGGQAAVLDHHQGSGDTCAAAMVAARADQVLDRFAALPQVTVVTHQRPDLDAVAGCWLAARLLADGTLPPAAAVLAAQVGRHDQGHADAGSDPAADLALVAALSLDQAGDDQARLEAGFALLDRIAAAMAEGAMLEHAVAAAAGPGIAQALDKAATTYAADAARARRGRLRLGDRPVAAALFVDPACPLLKHFFRHAEPGALLAVSWRLADGEWRHIVSVEPEADLRLTGLGAALEAAERRAEAGRTPRPGREIVPLGQGRFGGDIASPWYDGRGHAFTIVDSPSIGSGDDARCASLLSPEAVWAVLGALYAPTQEHPSK